MIVQIADQQLLDLFHPRIVLRMILTESAVHVGIRGYNEVCEIACHVWIVKVNPEIATRLFDCDHDYHLDS
jgi:hypothetical protein